MLHHVRDERAVRLVGKGGVLLFLLLGRCSGCGGTQVHGDSDLDLSEVDRQEDPPPDDPADDGEIEGTACGNGVVEPGEECDTTEEQACPTSCGTSGVMNCEACEWTECRPPGEACNGLDDDCNGVIDDLSGSRQGLRLSLFRGRLSGNAIVVQ